MSDDVTPFTFVNVVTYSKEDIIRENPSLEKDYNPYLVNRGLSYFSDTIFDAQEMNMNSGLDNIMQFDYLRLSIRKKKRFSKWGKKINNEDVIAVSEAFNYSLNKAREAVRILTPDQLKKIKEQLVKGGVNKKK